MTIDRQNSLQAANNRTDSATMNPMTPAGISLSKERLRSLMLGLCLGFASFFIGILISSYLAAYIFFHGWITGPASGFWVSHALGQIPGLLVAPIIAYLAGRIFHALRWMMACAIQLSAQGFSIGVTVASHGWEPIMEIKNIAIILAASIGGILLCAFAQKNNIG